MNTNLTEDRILDFLLTLELLLALAFLFFLVAGIMYSISIIESGLTILLNLNILVVMLICFLIIFGEKRK